MKIVKESLYEMNQIPFTNQNRNEPITQQYPMNRLQYEDADKPQDDQFTEEDYLECEVCANRVHPEEFKQGVCKKCADKGFWVDAFGKLHRGNSKVRDKKTEDEITKDLLGNNDPLDEYGKGDLRLRVGDVASDYDSNLVKIIEIGKLSNIYPDWKDDEKLSQEDFEGGDLFYKTVVEDPGPEMNTLAGETRYYTVNKYYSKLWRIDKYDPNIDPTDHDDWLLHQPDHDLYPDLY